MIKSNADFIMNLLNAEVETRKRSMMSCIDNGLDPYIKDRIKEYREALYTRNAFCDWMNDQVFEEGDSDENTTP